MRVIFMGSAEFSCRSLDRLLGDESIDVAAVVSQPDRPKGRDLNKQPCAVKVMASDKKTAIFTPDNINAPENVDVIGKFGAELFVVVAYGQILRKELLAMPRLGCINIHASLLPKYRGAAPIQWAVAHGEKVSGISTMYMNEKMDEGDVILQRAVAIEESDTAGTLHDRLAASGADLLMETIVMIANGTAPRIPQNDKDATYAPKLRKLDGRIDWSKPASAIYNMIRGFNPWPVCWCRVVLGEGIPDRILRVRKSRVESMSGSPGEILDIGKDGPLVAAGSGSIRLLEVQPEAGKVMSGGDFVRGCKLVKNDFVE